MDLFDPVVRSYYKNKFGGSGGGSHIDAITIASNGMVEATKVGEGYVPVIVALPVENYFNAEGVSF